MGSTLVQLRTRCTRHLAGRTDLDTEIDEALNDQVRLLSTGVVFRRRSLQMPELEFTTGNVLVAMGVDKILLSDVETQESIEIFAIETIRDVTTTKKLRTMSIRERDEIEIVDGLPSRYVRYGTDILFDNSVITAAGRNYILRVRRYHPTLSGSQGSIFPVSFDELIALGASLRVARERIRDYDMADELQKQFTSLNRALGLSKHEETRDHEFGVQVRMDR